VICAVSRMVTLYHIVMDLIDHGFRVFMCIYATRICSWSFYGFWSGQENGVNS
jgi:hypothetical protein